MTDTTETIQERFDREAAEHRRLVDTPLPDGWLEACMDAGFPGLPADMTVEEAHRRIRAIVNVVLPRHEQLVRERIAAALDRISGDCGRRAKEYADERSPVLEAEEGAYWNAGHLIRNGKEQEGIDV